MSSTTGDPHFLRPTILHLIHTPDPQSHSVAPLVEWVWVLLQRCIQDEQPALGEILLRRFWKELEAAIPLDRLEHCLAWFMPRLPLSSSEKLQYGDKWVRLLIRQGRWVRAKQLLAHLDTLAVTPLERAQYANRLGVFWKERAEYEQGEKFLKEAGRLAEAVGNDELAIIALNNLGNLEHARDAFAPSIAYFEAVLAHPAVAHYPRWRGAAAAGIAMNWADQHDYVRAVLLLEEAERLYADYRPGVLRVWLNRSYAQVQLGNLAEAFFYGQKALELARTLKEQKRESFALHNLGLAHAKAKQWQEATRYLEQALALREALGLPLLVKTTQAMLAEVRLLQLIVNNE